MATVTTTSEQIERSAQDDTRGYLIFAVIIAAEIAMVIGATGPDVGPGVWAAVRNGARPAGH